MTEVPPGWYVDPLDSGRGRFWDGERWSSSETIVGVDLRLSPFPGDAPPVELADEPSASGRRSGAKVDARVARARTMGKVLIVGGIVMFFVSIGYIAWALSHHEPTIRNFARPFTGAALAALLMFVTGVRFVTAANQPGDPARLTRMEWRFNLVLGAFLVLCGLVGLTFNHSASLFEVDKWRRFYLNVVMSGAVVFGFGVYQQARQRRTLAARDETKDESSPTGVR